ncbi:pyridoxamine 5'-phosphate oxidase family protein, partial [Streptomyces benahoarensis]
MPQSSPSGRPGAEAWSGPGGPVPRGVGWAVAEAREPEFVREARERFGRYPHHVLGTLRADGSPRLTGLEADFRFGELWLGMLTGSRKGADLHADPRFALHANPGPGTDLSDGDVRVSGRAVEVADEEVIRRYADEVRPPEPFLLFRAEVTEIVRVSVRDAMMIVQSWRPDGGLRRVR